MNLFDMLLTMLLQGTYRLLSQTQTILSMMEIMFTHLLSDRPQCLIGANDKQGIYY